MRQSLVSLGLRSNIHSPLMPLGATRNILRVVACQLVTRVWAPAIVSSDIIALLHRSWETASSVHRAYAAFDGTTELIFYASAGLVASLSWVALTLLGTVLEALRRRGLWGVACERSKNALSVASYLASRFARALSMHAESDFKDQET